MFVQWLSACVTLFRRKVQELGRLKFSLGVTGLARLSRVSKAHIAHDVGARQCSDLRDRKEAADQCEVTFVTQTVRSFVHPSPQACTRHLRYRPLFIVQLPFAADEYDS